MAGLTVPSKFTAIDKVSGPLSRMSQKAGAVSNKLESGFSRAERQMRKLDRRTGTLRESFGNLQGAIAGAFAVAGGAQLFSNMRNLTNLQDRVNALFDVGSKDAKKYATEVQALAAKHNESEDQIITAANAVVKQLGVGYEKAFNKINAGFNKGANVQGEFLDQLKEYPSQFEAMGLSADKAIGLITQTQKKGVFSDKGVDAIKEAQISLREMPNATKEAVNQLFNSSNAAAKLQKRLNTGETTMFQEIQRISNKLNKTDNQTKGMVLANVFRGAGEDAAGFVEEIGKLNPSLAKMEDTRSETTKGFDRTIEIFTKMKNVLLTSLVPAFNSVFERMRPVGKWMVENKGTVKTLVTAIFSAVAAYLAFKLAVFGVTTALKIARGATLAFNAVMGITRAITGASTTGLMAYRGAMLAYNTTTKIGTAITYGFSVAMAIATSPITLTVAAIGALIAAVVLIIKKWESWGAALSIIFGPLGFVISLVKSFQRNWESATAAFDTSTISGSLKAIGVVILDALLMPVQQLLELVGKLPTWLGGGAATNAAQEIQKLRNNIEGINTEVNQASKGRFDPTGLTSIRSNPKQAERETDQKRVEESRENVQLEIKDDNNRTKLKREKTNRSSAVKLTRTQGFF